MRLAITDDELHARFVGPLRQQLHQVDAALLQAHDVFVRPPGRQGAALDTGYVPEGGQMRAEDFPHLGQIEHGRSGARSVDEGVDVGAGEFVHRGTGGREADRRFVTVQMVVAGVVVEDESFGVHAHSLTG